METVETTEKKLVGKTEEEKKVKETEEEKEGTKVKALLDELTMEKFDSISDQIIEWANKSEAEENCRTLAHATRVVFEKAIDEATRSELYARLCRKMVDSISPNIQDGSRDADERLITGGQLFRKYLLSHCQENFERGWAAEDAAEASGGAELHSNECDAAREARRHGPGLVQFIGELYEMQMLREPIVHECIKKLLGNVDNPEEEEIESLCRLLTIAGKLLDHPKAHVDMDIYFARIGELGKRSDITPRARSILLVSSMVCVRQRLSHTFCSGSYRAT